MQQRRKYSQEFKQEAVQLANEPGVSISQVAHELGINDSVLRRWCKEQGDFGRKAFHGQGKPRDEEMAVLKRELARVKKERDFLKEAAAFFAKESKSGI
tara:strand:+ start:63 stop:359 length:297 start_codon:yes stop_codon:yes gene_type:complete